MKSAEAVENGWNLKAFPAAADLKMANVTYDLLWKETMRDLLDTLELDPPEGCRLFNV